MATHANVSKFGAAIRGGELLAACTICELVDRMGAVTSLEWDIAHSALFVMVWNAGSAVNTCGWPTREPATGVNMEALEPPLEDREVEESLNLVYPPSITLFSVPVIMDVLGSLADAPVDPSPPSAVVGVAFCVLHKLDPPERKLPKVMEPLALMKGVVSCC